MAHTQLRAARRRSGLSQQAAAARLRLSQPYYSQLEAGTRPLPAALAPRVVTRLGASPCVLPLPDLTSAWRPIPQNRLACALAALGYAPLAHLGRTATRMNPAVVIAGTLAHADLDVRLVEALPFVLAQFPELDTAWLAAQCRLLDLQNRLGFLAGLAQCPSVEAPHLSRLLPELERSRLAREDTLCRASMPAAERDWVRRNRPPEAVHWGLLTTLTREQLPDVS